MRHESVNRFGPWVRARREELKLPLRAFAIETELDPGNLSKYERELLPAPQDPKTLATMARALKLKQGTEEYQQFLDLAATSAGRIPPDLVNKPGVLESMPMLFRTARGKLTPDELLLLAEKLKSI